MQETQERPAEELDLVLDEEHPDFYELPPTRPNDGELTAGDRAWWL